MGGGQPQDGQGQGQIGAVIETVGQGLAALQDGIMNSNAPDEAKQLITQAFESFMGLLEIMGAGGPGGGQPQQMGGGQPQQMSNQQVL